MALLTNQKPALTGTAITTTSAAGGGDTLSNPRGKTALQVTNGGGGSINVTVGVPSPTPVRAADGQFPAQSLTSTVVAVAAGATKIIGPIPPAYNDGSGIVAISYSGVTSVTVAALDLDV